jgi:hypothetical protein
MTVSMMVILFRTHLVSLIRSFSFFRIESKSFLHRTLNRYFFQDETSLDHPVSGYKQTQRNRVEDVNEERSKRNVKMSLSQKKTLEGNN